MKNLVLIATIQLVYGIAFTQNNNPEPGPVPVSGQTAPRDGIYDMVDEPAEFPGGMQALKKFLADNLKYPERALKDSIEGKSYVKLLITDKGEVQRAIITKSAQDCPEFDQEALRVMYLMPKWKPARVNGKDVSSYYRLPVSFRLNQINKP